MTAPLHHAHPHAQEIKKKTIHPTQQSPSHIKEPASSEKTRSDRHPIRPAQRSQKQITRARDLHPAIPAQTKKKSRLPYTPAHHPGTCVVRKSRHRSNQVLLHAKPSPRRWPARRARPCPRRHHQRPCPIPFRRFHYRFHCRLVHSQRPPWHPRPSPAQLGHRSRSSAGREGGWCGPFGRLPG